jgi:Tfp pilus assembly protein PilO
MIDAINTASGAQFGTASKVSLVSRVGAGAEAVVTQVKVDQKLDHMESRERSIKSNYSSATTAAAAAEIARRDQELRDGYDELEQQN